MNAKILFVSRQVNAAELSGAFNRARMAYGLITVVAPDMKRMRMHLGQSAYDVVIVDQLVKGVAEEVVREVLNTVPWQEVIIIGKRPLMDASLKAHLVPSVEGVVRMLPGLLQ